MDDERIQECKAIIAREERAARMAPSEAAAELHRQKVMLYRVELAALKRRRTKATQLPPAQVFSGR